MELFRMSQRPVAFLGEPTELLEAASPTAMGSIALMECLLINEPVSPDVYQELLSGGRAFVVVEGQSKEGYLRADAIVNAIHGLRLIDKTFFKNAKLSQYTLPVVPVSSEDLDKESSFRDLVNFFVLCYTTLYWEAYDKYGFDKRH